MKANLLEYLTPKQRAEHSGVQMNADARQATDHFFGVGNDKIVRDVEDTNFSKSEIHKKVEDHLGRTIEPDDYKAGLAVDKYGRKTRLSKLIKDPDLQKQFVSDSTRSGAKAVESMKISVHRGTEVFGQTNPEPNEDHPNGHSWASLSCKNITSGMHREYLENEVGNGTVVVFGHDHDGKEIYRATLQPYHNGSHTIHVLNSEYGVKHPAFKKAVLDVSKELSSKSPNDRVYKINKNVYDDLDFHTAVNPNMNASDITGALKNGSKQIRSAAIRHPDVKPEHITQALTDEDPDIRQEAITHPNATEDHITQALKDEDAWVRSGAVAHPKATSEHISTALKDRDSWVRSRALVQPQVTPEHITQGLKDKDEFVRSTAIRHPNATPEHIDHVLKHDESWPNREKAAAHKNATDEQIESILRNPAEHTYVKVAALQNPKSTRKHVDIALKDSDETVRREALYHPTITFKDRAEILGVARDNTKDDDEPLMVGGGYNRERMRLELKN